VWQGNRLSGGEGRDDRQGRDDKANGNNQSGSHECGVYSVCVIAGAEEAVNKCPTPNSQKTGTIWELGVVELGLDRVFSQA
jgi:hypothetical protein